MEPEYKNASKAFVGKVTFAEVNVDTQTQVSAVYAIESLPTMILFKKNKIIKRSVGFLDQQEIEAFVKQALQ
ncbi:MAG: thioredoxin domain-containing protein [Sulfurovum sp.]|nr:thioredoxin domain-containing protein [Sulfurovum sp.]